MSTEGVGPPFFYRSLEWTNQTLALKRTFNVFAATRFSYMLEKGG